MNKTIEQITRYLLIFLAIFIPFRELISLFTTSFIKFVPDALIWGLFIVYMIVNRFKVNLKKYDVMSEEQIKKANKLLKYAKQTYIASFLSSMLFWTFMTRKTKIF